MFSVPKSYYSVLMQAVNALDPNTKDARRDLYSRAKLALWDVPEAGWTEREALEKAIKDVEESYLHGRSVDNFKQRNGYSSSFHDGDKTIARKKSRLKRILVHIVEPVAVFFTGLGVMSGVGISTSSPSTGAVRSLTIEQNTQVNARYEVGPSAEPPRPPTPLRSERRSAERESEEGPGKERLISLHELLSSLRDLRYKLVGNGELLDRLDNVLDAIAKLADSLADDRKLIEQMFDLARALADIEDIKDKAARAEEVLTALLAIESIVEART